MAVTNKQYAVPWHKAEEKIRQEIHWLSAKLSSFFEEEKHAPIGCKFCYLRHIATLIMVGDVRATEIERDSSLSSFWLSQKKFPRNRIHHGGGWHRDTMERIEHHFLQLGFEVEREPTLHQGRADLGVYKQGQLNLFIEVGTVSLYKLALNLLVQKDFIYLMAPSDDYLIEFVKTENKQNLGFIETMKKI